MKLKLVATPLSHFGRKVRILLDAYQLPYVFEDIGNVAFTKTPSEAGGNPLMKVPVLHIDEGKDSLIESDHIASYLVDRFDPKDQFSVLSRSIEEFNIRAVLNGVMNEEVKLIVAGRHQVPVAQFSFFQKSRDAIGNGLYWLEDHHHLFFDVTKLHPLYRDFHLVCLWEHLAYYGNIVDLKPFPRLADKVQAINAAFPILHQSAPFTLKPK